MWCVVSRYSLRPKHINAIQSNPMQSNAMYAGSTNQRHPTPMDKMDAHTRRNIISASKKAHMVHTTTTSSSSSTARGGVCAFAGHMRLGGGGGGGGDTDAIREWVGKRERCLGGLATQSGEACDDGQRYKSRKKHIHTRGSGAWVLATYQLVTRLSSIGACRHFFHESSIHPSI